MKESGTAVAMRSESTNARERLIAAGTAAMRERGGRPLPDLNADDVIERAQVPKSTLYQLWGNFDEYRRDVLVELIRTADRQDSGAIVDAVVPILERGGNPAELLVTGSVAYFEVFSASDFCTWVLAAYPHRDEVGVGPEIAAALNDARDRFARPIAMLVAASRRRPRPGVDAATMSQLLVATYLGMAMRERLDPGCATKELDWVGPDGSPERWPRIAIATQAIIARCTELVPQ